MNSRIQAVVFDLDATIINLGEFVDWRSAQKKIIEEYITYGCDEETVNNYGSRGLFNLLSVMHEDISTKKGLNEACIIQSKVYSIIDKYEEDGIKCGFMPGVLNALNWLIHQNIKLGVCTSNSTDIAVKILNNLGLKDFFHSIIGRTVGMKLKPNPDQLLMCFKKLEADPRRSVMVGDSHNDILAGKFAGTMTIAIPVYFTRLKEMNEAQPDLIIKSMSELPNAIISLEKKLSM